MQRDRIIHRIASLADPQHLAGASLHQLEVFSMQLERHYETFQRLQNTIELDDGGAFEHTHRDDLEDAYCSAKAFIAQQLDSVRVSPSPPYNSTTIASTSRRVILPKLQLPKFGGHAKDWLEFHNMFQVLVHQNNELSSVEKFHYLRSCLTDKAAKLIQSLEVTPGNYTKAVELLTIRYNNTRYIFKAHLQEIFDIRRLHNPTVASLREYIDIINANLRALQSLATSQQITDGIFIQLVTSKLDPDTQTKWEEEVSKISDAQPSIANIRMPTWSDLTTFMERRCQTTNLIEYGRTNKAIASTSSIPKKTTLTLVTNNSSKCVLCNETPHHNPFKCQRFMALDVMARYQQAKNARLCLNCLTPLCR
uniref:Uncharacterized protein n=1 Tax=Musca domestica TaxID=7370 RepID=A0A1I8NK77_MUSDO